MGHYDILFTIVHPISILSLITKGFHYETIKGKIKKVIPLCGVPFGLSKTIQDGPRFYD
jgi:hypothetical protein